MWRRESSTRHGRDAIGDVAVRLQAGSEDAALFAGGAQARPPFVFFDLETTGLSGGAGTYAFLVGCGRFGTDGAFVTRQFVMTRYADERPLLEAVAGELAGAGALVSFNGKSFDAPVLGNVRSENRRPSLRHCRESERTRTVNGMLVDRARTSADGNPPRQRRPWIR